MAENNAARDDPSSKGSAKKAPSARKSKSANPAAAAVPDAIDLIKADHRRIEQLFEQYAAETNADDKARIARDACRELIIHTALEEEIFYPAFRSVVEDGDALSQAQVEHDSAKLLIAELLSGSPADAFYDAKVKVLAEHIKHHIKDEERAGEGILARARKAGVITRELGAKIARRRQDLHDEDRRDLRAPRPVSFTTQPEADLTRETREESPMARNGRQRSDRDRGRGRMSDEEHDRIYGGQWGAGPGRSHEEGGYGAAPRQYGRDYGRQWTGGRSYEEGGYGEGRGQWRQGGWDEGRRSDRYAQGGQYGQDREYGQGGRYSDYGGGQYGQSAWDAERAHSGREVYDERRWDREDAYGQTGRSGQYEEDYERRGRYGQGGYRRYGQGGPSGGWGGQDERSGMRGGSWDDYDQRGGERRRQGGYGEHAGGHEGGFESYRDWGGMRGHRNEQRFGRNRNERDDTERSRGRGRY